MHEPWEPFDRVFDWAIEFVGGLPVDQLQSAYEKWSKLPSNNERVFAVVQVLKCVISQNPDLHTVH